MIKAKYLEPIELIPLAYVYGSLGERQFKVLEDIQVELSDGYQLLIPKGFKTDLRSTPKWAWSVVRPYNDALLAYLIHDRLYSDKLGQMAHFSVDGIVKPYLAKEFADKEMYRWAVSLAPHRKAEAKLSYLLVKNFGNDVYWGRTSVPI